MAQDHSPSAKPFRFIGLAAWWIAILSFPVSAQEDHSGLTAAKFRRDCLMCHNKAAPEGVSPEILVGLHPQPGLTPAAAMPTLTCWRRCEKCFPQMPARGK
jgi:hypothetical protein